MIKHLDWILKVIALTVILAFAATYLFLEIKIRFESGMGYSPLIIFWFSFFVFILAVPTLLAISVVRAVIRWPYLQTLKARGRKMIRALPTDEPYFVYLRAFDRERVEWATTPFGLGWIFRGRVSGGFFDRLIRFLNPFRERLDEALAIALADEGPVIALRGQHWRGLNGVAEIKVKHEDWRRKLHEIIDGAKAILIVPGDTEGVVEELVLLATNDLYAHKTILIAPPSDKRAAFARTWQKVREQIASKGLRFSDRYSSGFLLLISSDETVPWSFLSRSHASLRKEIMNLLQPSHGGYHVDRRIGSAASNPDLIS